MLLLHVKSLHRNCGMSNCQEDSTLSRFELSGAHARDKTVVLVCAGDCEKKLQDVDGKRKLESKCILVWQCEAELPCMSSAGSPEAKHVMDTN